MYPLNGNIPASIGHVQSSRLALSRFAYKMHRQALAWGTMGSAGLCKKYLMPVMRKQQYRFQMTNPIPPVNGRFACSAIGASTMPPDAGRAYPAGGEEDRKSVVSGKSVSVRLAIGGRRTSTKKNTHPLRCI